MKIREYGESGRTVILVHGGPGAPGYMAPVARRLADSFRVIEPFQRGSGADRLDVATHVADLHDVIGSCDDRPALVGHSWGAMLALACAAAHPSSAAALVLIGCGTFDPAARERMREICEERMDDALRRRLAELPDELTDPDERLRAAGDLLLPLYSFDPVVTSIDAPACDAKAHRESWDDMVRLQEQGTYPAAFAAIDAPVLMLHGAVDPHPGRLVHASLRPHLPQVEYREWARCGHYPWLERAVADEFFAVLRAWLVRHLPDRRAEQVD